MHWPLSSLPIQSAVTIQFSIARGKCEVTVLGLPASRQGAQAFMKDRVTAIRALVSVGSYYHSMWDHSGGHDVGLPEMFRQREVFGVDVISSMLAMHRPIDMEQICSSSSI